MSSHCSHGFDIIMTYVWVKYILGIIDCIQSPMISMEDATWKLTTWDFLLYHVAKKRLTPFSQNHNHLFDISLLCQ